jgi:beta-glucosidase
VQASASDSVDEGVRAASRAQVAIVIVGYDGHDEGEFLKPSRERDAAALALFPQPDGTPSSDKVQIARRRAAEQPAAASDSSHRPEADLASRPVGGDRSSIRLRPQDVRLIRAVSAANPRTVVCIVTAGAVITEEWRHVVPGLLISWYNGWANGPALADVLSGDEAPAGRLPWSVPTTEAHLPPFDANADQVVYNKWFGQRLLDRMGVTAAYPLGYGLSYTQFQLEDARLVLDPGTAGPEAAVDGDASGGRIDVLVKNVGPRDGWSVVQVYGLPDFGPVPQDFPNRVLVGFQAEWLGTKTSKCVSVRLDLQPLKRWSKGGFVLDAKAIAFEVSQYAGDPESLRIPYNMFRTRI